MQHQTTLTNVTLDSETVELHIKCKQLDNEDAWMFGETDGQCVLYSVDWNNNRAEIGKTEVCQDHSSPDFETPISVDYVFQKRQDMILVCYDIDDGGSSREVVGEVRFQMGQIMAHQDGGIELTLTENGQSKGKVHITPVKLGKERFEYEIDFKLQNVQDQEFWGKSDPFMTLERASNPTASTPQEVESWERVYETEIKDEDLNPDFKPFRIHNGRLNRCNENCIIRFTIRDHSKSGNHKKIGWGYFSVTQVMNGQTVFQSSNKDGENTGTLIIENFNRIKSYSLGDYLKFGVHLSMVLAVDFTDTNGDPRDPKSLHYLNPQGRNKYEEVIVKAGQILQNYDTDQQIPAYGYGFSAPNFGINDVSFCCPINGNFDAPHFKGFEAILPAYRNLVSNMVPASPNKISPIIQRAIGAAQSSWNSNKSIYNIVLILTSGRITDRDEAKSLINQARALPISLIIVAVGSGNFKDMQYLDGDHEVTARDFVSFVEYDKHAHNPAELSAEILKEIPDQITTFYRKHGINPY